MALLYPCLSDLTTMITVLLSVMSFVDSLQRRAMAVGRMELKAGGCAIGHGRISGGGAGPLMGWDELGSQCVSLGY